MPLMRLLYTLMLVACCTYMVQGQGALYLKSFQGDVRGKSILLQWVTQKGFTCEDLVVEYSTDTINWKEIHKIPVICGSEQERKEYSYIFDHAIPDKVNYFRIDLGVFWFSDILKVSPVISGIAVVPNPVTENTNIHFSNQFRENVRIEFTQMDGKVLIYKDKGPVNEFSLRRHFNPGYGFYILKLMVGDAEPKYVRISVMR